MKKNHFIYCLFLLFFMMLPYQQGFSSPPKPVDKAQSLETLNKRLAQEKQEKILLSKKKALEEKDLAKIQDKLVKASRLIQKNEGYLYTLEDEIALLKMEELELQEKLKNDEKSIASLIIALERIKRLPPEALLVKPNAPVKTAQSVMLMREILPTIYKQADTLKTNLIKLDTLSQTLESKKKSVMKMARDLENEQETLTTLIQKRKSVYQKIETDLDTQTKRIKQISLKAKNLEDLIRKLNEDRARSQARKMTHAAILKTPAPRKTLPAKNGAWLLPLNGAIRISYGQPDAFGAPSQGVTIEARAGALVVAPMTGIVRFAGKFKNYGHMVILEHKNGYHSLIAGLEKIDTVVGRRILSGEPLGNLYRAGDAQNPSLYYEIRLKGRPINPAVLFADLS